MRRTVALLLTLILAIGLPVELAQAAAVGTPSPYVKLQFFDNNGNPAASHKLFVYTAGTSTKTTTWTDSALSSANTNPIVLDASGRCVIFLRPGTSVKYVLAPSTDSDPPLSPVWTFDNISAVPAGASASNTEVSGTAGETLTTGESVYLSDGSGGTTAGRWYRTDADAIASANGAQATGFAVADISTGAAGLIRRGGQVTGLSGLTPGSVYYASATAGAITPTPPTNARVVGQAESATILTIVSSLPDGTGTIAGLVSTGAQTIAGAKAATGQWTFTLNPLGLETYGRLAASLVKNNNTTFSDATGLSFAIAANEVWEFEFVLEASATAVSDSKFQLTGPAAPTAVTYGVVTSSSVISTTMANAFSTAVAIANSGAANHELVILRGTVRNGANAGTVQLQYAQNTADVSNATLFIESFVKARRIS